MKQMSVVITLGIIQMIILSLFGLYFYQLKHSVSVEKNSGTVESSSAR
ncbi:MAG: hypothetical protein WCG73_03460 [Candidatus Moraniibacteriota bacterium]